MTLAPAVIVDMDDTLCDVGSVRHFAERGDFDLFHEKCADCPPHRAVVDWCIDQHRRRHAILVVTGRDDWSRDLTAEWLATHLPVPVTGLHMRRDGDYRANVEVKREIHANLSRRFDIRGAIDDDPEIAAMWEELNIPTAVVLDGYVYPPMRPPASA